MYTSSAAPPPLYPSACLILLSVPCQHAIVEDDANEDELKHNDKDEAGLVPDGPQVHVVHHLPRRPREPTRLLDLGVCEGKEEGKTGNISDASASGF